MRAIVVALGLLVTLGCAPSRRATVVSRTTDPAPRAASVSATVPPNEPIEVAVTIDDLPRHGPDVPGLSRRDIHERMIAVLRAHHLPPTVGFVNAERLIAHPEDRAALEAWARAGQRFGNHTYSHVDANVSSLDVFLADVAANEPILASLEAGAPASRWKVLRYPYLREGASVAARDALRVALDARGYRIAEVTIDFYDWAYHAPHARCLAKGDTGAIAALRESYLDQAAAELRFSDGAARELLGRPIRQVLLLHAGAFSAEMLDELLSVYEKNAVRFISLEDALADPVYEERPVPLKGGPVSGTLLHQIRRSRATRWPSMAPPPDTLLDLVCR